MEMKRRAQEALRREYEARRAELGSCYGFQEAKASESELAKAAHAEIAQAPRV